MGEGGGGGLKTTGIFSLTVLGARSLKSRCRQGWLLLEAPREKPSRVSLLVSGGCQQPFGIPWLVASSLQALSLCPYGLLPPLPLYLESPFSYKNTVIRFRAYPKSKMISPQDPYVNSICKDPISKEGPTHRFQRSGLGHIFLRDTSRPSTVWVPQATLQVATARPPLEPSLSLSSRYPSAPS